ncbi:MAG: LuxR C-terminal-related transcriptional regulator [Actinomycetota bacterium]|nr:LuxR C-terminal-related transcriptional regulator [Actinomycetota bacterium]
MPAPSAAMDLLLRRLKDAGACVALGGVGGSGKTTALAALANRADDDARPALRVSGRRLEQGVPYSAFDLVIPSPPEDGSDGDRVVRAAVLEQVARGGWLLVDDAQWLDPASIRVVASIAERAAEANVCLVVAHRPTTGRRDLAVLVDLCARQGPMIRLEGLDEQAVAVHAAEVLGAAPSAELVDVALEQTGGSPLLVDRLLRGWQAEGSLDRGTLASDAPPVPASVVDLVSARYEQLDESVRWTLVALSLGSPLDDDTLAEMSGQDPDASRRAHAELAASGLLLADKAEPLPVVAGAVTLLVPGAERRRYHLAVAEALQSRGGSSVDIAEHLHAAGVAGPHVAAAFGAAGADTVVESPELARTWFERASAIAPDDHELAVRLAEVEVRLGELDAAIGRADRILAAASSTSPGDAAPIPAGVRARATVTAAAVSAQRGLWRRAGELFLAVRDHPDEADLVFVWQAVPCFVAAGAVDEARKVAEVARASTPHPAPARLEAVAAVAEALLVSLDADGSVAVAGLMEAATLYESAPTATPVPVLPHETGASLASAGGEFVIAEELVGRALGRDLGGSVLAGRMRLLSGWAALRRGEWASSTRVVDETADADDGLGVRERVLRLAIEAALARRASDIARISEVAERAVSLLPRFAPDVLTLEAIAELGVVVERAGRGEQIGGLHQRTDELLAALDHPPVWALLHQWSLLEAAIAAKRTDDVGPLAAEVERLAARGGRLSPLGPAAAAWRRVMSGDVEIAEIEQAVEALSAIGLVWEASQLTGQAAIRTSDASVAKNLLGQARNLRTVAGSEGAAPTGVTSMLSEREIEVSQYVVDGLTYKEIGAQLFISPKTVEHHVAKIRQKLGATTRAEMLAALREELGAAGAR